METQFTSKWAILLGPCNYLYVKPLKYSTADITAVAKVFRESLGFADDHVLEFGSGLRAEPVAHAFYHQLGSLTKGGLIQPDDLVIFYFSGHGIRDNKDYLLPIEATPHNLKKTAIEFEEVLSLLTDSSCKNVVMFIDACRGEVVTGQKSVTSIGEETKILAERAGFGSIFSCEPQELSYEIDELGHGSFTYSFLQGLNDGSCATLEQMYRRLVKDVPLLNRKYNKQPQTPYPVQAGDKWELPVFQTITGAVGRHLETLTTRAQKLFDELNRTIFAQIIDFLTDVKERTSVEAKGLTEDEQWKIDLIESMCSGQRKRAAFELIWKSSQQGSPRPVIKTEIPGKLGEIKGTGTGTLA